jgi:hypothetical protein
MDSIPTFLIVIGIIIWYILLLIYPDVSKTFFGAVMIFLGGSLIANANDNGIVALAGIGLILLAFIFFSSTKWWKKLLK